MTDALQLLSVLSSKVSTKYPSAVKPIYNDREANGLAECIIDWFILNGHFATRLFGVKASNRYRHAEQATEFLDVLACTNGQLVAVKIKSGPDCLTQQQAETAQAMAQAGGLFYVARDFQSFYEWYMAYVQTGTESSPSLYHHRHPIAQLATPDLFNPKVN